MLLEAQLAFTNNSNNNSNSSNNSRNNSNNNSNNTNSSNNTTRCRGAMHSEPRSNMAAANSQSQQSSGHPRRRQ